MESGPLSVDRRIAELARRQHGVVAARQLAELGLTQQSVSERAASGRLHRVRRGVYAVGHPIVSVRGRWLAAVLACGPGAALSHVAAAALWEIRRSDATLIDVTVPRTGRAQPGHRGAKRVRATLATYEPGTTRTRSGLERLFLAICDTHGLPRPLVNHRLEHDAPTVANTVRAALLHTKAA